MGISKLEISSARTNLLKTVRSKRATLGLLFVLNAGFIFTYIINPLPEKDCNSTDFVKHNTPPPFANLPDFCNGVETANKYSMTSTKFTRARSKFLPKDRVILVRLRTYNKRNIPKLNGGDIIFAWARQMYGDGMVPGNVIDHRNGSYTGLIRVFWTGRTNVHLRLVSAVENTCLRYKALYKYGDIVFTLRQPYGLRAVYSYNNSKVFAPCNTNSFIYGSSRVCNFTTLNGGMSWYCGLPAGGQFQCKDLQSFSLGSFKRRARSVEDKIRSPGHGIFRIPMSVDVTFKSDTNSSVTCNERTPLESWTEKSPIGFFLKRLWIPTNCKTNFKHTIANYRTCLQNRTLIFLGDSTVRQYINFFIKDILGLDETIEKGLTFGPNFQTYHGHHTFTNHGITLIYRKQAMPLHFAGGEIPINNIQSFPQILDSLTNSDIPGISLVVLLNYHAHFTSYPPEKYRERLKYLVASLKRLFYSKPEAKVFFKGPSPCISDSKWWDPYISLVYKKILTEEFTDILDKVTYLNIWEISVAHNVLDVHPQGQALKSQLHQFMTFLC
ncbi:NXPE family member 3-like [Ruditapes philippinarum]|uniref:NXPE family member 3-like n=1 Tax=Ruditapes philippinarum TaxID=129788 RepID=UPI00295B56A4|nr:NXPE family member 3-like [Ruditapes philippinarum]